MPMTPEFVFEMTREAAAKNFLILKKYDFSLETAIDAQTVSPLGYSSFEFGPPKTLQRTFQHHPLWTRMEQLLTNGPEWPLEEISESDRAANLTEACNLENTRGHPQNPTSQQS